MNVYEKLNAARAEFHGLKLVKTGHNKFAGYNYFELGDFLIPALNVFAKNGLCATVSFNAETANMVIRNVEKPEEMITLFSPMGSAALKGCHEVQNIGAVETYQRRYLWVVALEIVEHDALDATTGSDKTAKGTITPTTGLWEALTDQQRSRLTDLSLIVKEYCADKDYAGAYEAIDAAGLDADEKAALVTRFDSKERSAMSKWKKEQRELATQP